MIIARKHYEIKVKYRSYIFTYKMNVFSINEQILIYRIKRKTIKYTANSSIAKNLAVRWKSKIDTTDAWGGRHDPDSADDN